ncbi:TniQ family protein [Acidimangrovimonas pyrenivorans]|uniref:TniQ family protein n=1 Tax=Acidimangrovimonas pyrenivorans TaxID=2030798 RepID=A0ABV7AN05_9RHOB
MLDGESTISWVARLATFHSGRESRDWLAAIGLSQQDVVKCSTSSVERLRDMTGVSKERIREGAYVHERDRTFVHRGERFGTHFSASAFTTFCPACLLDDTGPGNLSASMRVGRVNWFFMPVRSCPKHGIELSRTRNTHYSQGFQDMAIVAPSDVELARLVDESDQRKVSPLQLYVENRFDGAHGPAWLDGQTIDQAAKACEMVGACLEFGAHCKLDHLTDAQWDQAGAAGFEAAAKGEEGLRLAMDQIRQDHREGDKKGGPQAVFGRLYQWLQFNKSNRDRGPIRTVVREYILDTMAIEAGTNLFGEIVDRRRFHSVCSLSKATGLHPKTLNRALSRAGLLSIENEDTIDNSACADASEAEALALRIRNSLPIKRVPEYLNCNRTQAQALVRQGIVRQLCPDLGDRGGVLTGVAIDELETFLVRFRTRGQAVAVASDGMLDLIAASEIARLPVVDIVQLVLDGKLERLELLPEELRFRSVLVDPDEVREVSSKNGEDLGFAQDKVASLFGLTSSHVNALRTQCDDTGRPFLNGTPLANARGTIRFRYASEEVERFAQDYVSLVELAENQGKTPREVKKELLDQGIAPIAELSRLPRDYYRRVDL